jgi:ketosteroid isomerase-like protein
MQKFIASMGLLALFATPTGAPASQNDDVSQLRALERTFATAMTNKDLDAVMAVYAPGESLFVFDVVGPPSAHSGSDQYRDALRRMFAAIDGPLRLTMSDLQIDVSGDVGYSRSLQRVSGKHVKGGKPFDYTVRVTDVYRKIDGKWLIVQEHLSLPIERNTFTPILQSSVP